MINTRRTLIALSASALILAACGGDGATPTTGATTTTPASVTTTEAPPDGSGAIRFGSGDYPFAVYYPADWEGDTSQDETVLVVKAPTTGTDEFIENFNIIVTEEAAGFTLSGYVDANLTTLENAIPEFTLFDEAPSGLGGVDAEILYYGGTFDGVEVEFLQVFAIYEDLAYIITYTGGADFDTYGDTFEDFLDSWEWTN